VEQRASANATALVAHSFDGEVKSTAFANATRKVLDHGGPDGELRVVSPYLGAAVIAELLRGHRFRLVTDLDECFGGARDGALAAYLAEHASSVRHVPGVHAKLFASAGALMLGSANLTKSGLAERDELGIVTTDAGLLRDVGAWFDQLWGRAAPIDAAMLGRAQVAAVRAPRRLERRDPASPQLPALKRGLGWLALGAARAFVNPWSEETSAEALRELAQTLARLTSSPEDARFVLGLFREALFETGLTLPDEHLHLGFGLKARRIHVTVAHRYVVWGFAGHRPKHVRSEAQALGFIMADGGVVDDLLQRFPGDAWSGWYDDPRVRTVKVTVPTLRTCIDRIRPSWHEAIRREVEAVARGERPQRSPGRRARRPSFDAIMRDERLFEEVVASAFDAADAGRGSKAREERATGR
jgi:hypothetical protein